MVLNPRNTPQLPEAPNGWFKSLQRRIALALNGDPKPEDLADRSFIKAVENSANKAKKGILEAEVQLTSWQSAQKRYEMIVAYIKSITEWQNESLDKIIEAQTAIAKFQEELETFIGSLKGNEWSALAKLKQIKDETKRLREEQEDRLKKLLEQKAAPTDNDNQGSNNGNQGGNTGDNSGGQTQ